MHKFNRQTNLWVHIDVLVMKSRKSYSLKDFIDVLVMKSRKSYSLRDFSFNQDLIFTVYTKITHDFSINCPNLRFIFLSLLAFVFIYVHACLQHQMKDVIFLSLLAFVFIYVHTCLQHQMKDVIFFKSSILPYSALCILVNINVTCCTLVSGHRCSIFTIELK